MSKAFDGVEIQWVDAVANDGETGLVAVHLTTPSSVIRLD
jgi:hypothetical protein